LQTNETHELQDVSPDGAWLTALAELDIPLLEREGVPLSASVSLAAVLDDLIGLAETPAPAVVRHVLGDKPVGIAREMDTRSAPAGRVIFVRRVKPTHSARLDQVIGL
jgi:hypothetical protein